MTQPDDPTRQLLAPRARTSRPRAADEPSHQPSRRFGWRYGAIGALILVGAAGVTIAGRWLWPPPAGNAAAPAAASIDRQDPPRSIASALSTPAVVPLAALSPEPAKASSPLTDISDLLRAPPSDRLRWSRFKANPAIVVIEYPDLHQQGLAMNRLAAMFEKRSGRRDRVPTEAELADLIRRSGDTIASFYQGHDYPAAKVARFFSLVEAQRATLNAHELRLRSVLLEAELLSRGGNGGYRAVGNQAVVSFTGVQPDDPTTAPDELVDSVRREAVLRHELSHGEFFTDSVYRTHCMRFWRDVLTASERRMLSAYLKSLDYSPADEELMANETQALLMHTPDQRAFNARSLGISEAALAQLRSRFKAGEPAHGLRR